MFKSSNSEQGTKIHEHVEKFGASVRLRKTFLNVYWNSYANKPTFIFFSFILISEEIKLQRLHFSSERFSEAVRRYYTNNLAQSASSHMQLTA